MLYEENFTPATIEEVRSLVNRMYDTIWADWYSDYPNATKAVIEVSLEDTSAGYSHSRNLLINPIGEWNLADADIRDANGWPIWKIQLVHEMLHEWQFKKPTNPSDEANELHTRLGAKFYGQGHGPDFFQAIVEKAPYFRLTAEEMIRFI